MVELLEPLDLPAGLPPIGLCCAALQERRRPAEFGGDPALENHAGAFFLQLDKDGAVRCRDAVAADPQLFLVGGFFDRGADELPVWGIVVNVADAVPAVAVGLHMGLHPLEQRLLLAGGQKVLFFAPFKMIGGSGCHRGHLLLLSLW